jgi:hypothetical protein
MAKEATRTKPPDFRVRVAQEKRERMHRRLPVAAQERRSNVHRHCV